MSMAVVEQILMIHKPALQRRRIGLIRRGSRSFLLVAAAHSPSGRHSRRQSELKPAAAFTISIEPHVQIWRCVQIIVVSFFQLRQGAENSAAEHRLHRRLAHVPITRPQQPHRSVHRIHSPPARFEQQGLK